MQLHYLEEFVILAQICNYQKAAEQLHIAQPTLTKHIKAIEDEVGIALFNRSAKRVVLNAYGQLLYERLPRMLTFYHDILNDIKEMQRDTTHDISVGYTSTAGYYGIFQLVTSFQELYPMFRIKLQEYSILGEGKNCSIVFLAENEMKNFDYFNRYVHKTFYRDHIVALLPKHYDLSGEKTIRLQQLTQKPFIMFLPDIQVEAHAVVNPSLNYFIQSGTMPNIVSSSMHMSNIFKMVSQGIGYSLVPSKCISEFDLNGMEKIDISPEIPFNITVCYPATRQFGKYEKLLLDFLLENANPH